MEKVDQLAIGVLLQEAPITGRAVGDAQVEHVGEALLGARDLALHTQLELLLAILGCGGEVDGVLALALVVVEGPLSALYRRCSGKSQMGIPGSDPCE